MTHHAEKFWFGWLKIAAVCCTFFGIFMVFFNQTPAFNFLNKHINRIFYSGHTSIHEFLPFQGWLLSVLGATMTGWGISILFLIYYPLQKKEPWAWNAIMISMIVWFSLDTFMSAKYGALFNVVINIIFMLQFVAPLLFIRNLMISTEQAETEFL